METRETFVITVFRDPERSIQLRGRVRHVISRREATFRNLQELSELLQMTFDDAQIGQEYFASERDILSLRRG